MIYDLKPKPQMKILDVPQSGSVAGMTSSRNRFGQYKRTRATPVNPNTARQVLVRTRLVAASQAWAALDSGIRAQWVTYANAHAVTDSLGQSIYLTGHQAFVSHYSAWANAGLVPADVPPSEAPVAAPVLSVFAPEAGGAVSMNVAVAPTATVPLVVEAGPYTSAGVDFNADYRFIQAFTAYTSTTVVVFTTAIGSKFGVAAAGQKIFVRARYVSLLGGVSAYATISSVVTAP